MAPGQSWHLRAIGSPSVPNHNFFWELERAGSLLNSSWESHCEMCVRGKKSPLKFLVCTVVLQVFNFLQLLDTESVTAVLRKHDSSRLWTAVSLRAATVPQPGSLLRWNFLQVPQHRYPVTTLFQNQVEFFPFLLHFTSYANHSKCSITFHGFLCC